ncbi:hypothetical protein PsalMR5_04168 (plasmid) [Piscirickettsia salmonis]|uniref:hypothetical protein n=1 Tax=Piscirickettsia salmonis TaxID=1238 RepID=UPI0012BB1BB6|nr:hypothetical protein [Piscirickettsia salmonis]QGP54012.1 hypothetical protein PsalSR1_01440 [Piscirickettsia salmonis]QGP56673.1 hypothetical protein PsalSR1_04162 [Piscirickettsia salmonis]QGP60089.1 hypothetical protein PsalBI1_02690 [Piscirickettsia salmonis]QGP63588.1 hypothetical protein PsalMR5_01448 [Piscirickettsia salmonis]QGP66243.1 hypothetical protein PsalMR5_04168 [Piscirickettsia salmonis]
MILLLFLHEKYSRILELQAYSQDLRERVIEAYKDGLSRREISTLFKVHYALRHMKCNTQ